MKTRLTDKCYISRLNAKGTQKVLLDNAKALKYNFPPISFFPHVPLGALYECYEGE